MRKIAFITIFISIILSIQSAYAQNTYITTNTRYQPLSYDRLLLQAQAQAYQRQREAEERARRSAQFDQYQEAAYKCLNRGDYHGFLRNSSYALNTGFSNAQIY